MSSKVDKILDLGSVAGCGDDLVAELERTDCHLVAEARGCGGDEPDGGLGGHCGELSVWVEGWSAGDGLIDMKVEVIEGYSRSWFKGI